MGFGNEFYCALWFGILLWFDVGQILSTFGIMYIDNRFNKRVDFFWELVIFFSSWEMMERNVGGQLKGN